MATSQMSGVIQHLRRAVLLRDGAGLTDEQLLEDYLSRHEEAALAALVRRHGPMVWGVCRRVLRSYHDAEDAFQATFLVLVRKAASIASPELLANWLYGVAHQTALKARATTAKRRARERQVTEMPEPAATEQDLWSDLQPLLDQELSRLPDRYRVAIVLCDLEGKTRKEAARQLGVPEGTLAARVARGRVMLAKRLARNGLAVSGGALAAALAHQAGTTGVTPVPPAPTSVVFSTIKAAGLFAAGQAAATGAISAKVAALAEGVLKTMLMSKIKVATPLMLAVAALSGAAGLIYAQKDPERTNQQPAQAGVARPAAPVEGRYDRDVQNFLENAKWVLTNADGKKNTISVRCMDRMYLDDIPVAAKARVLIDGKDANLTDLKAGMCIDLTNLAAGQPTVTWIAAFTDNNERDVFRLEAVDAEKKTINVRNMLGGNTATLSVAQNAKTVFRTVKGGKRESKLSDLKAGMRISLQMAAGTGGIVVRGIEVELIDSAGEKVVVKP